MSQPQPDRPDWVHCIRRPDEAGKGKSLCGRAIVWEWAFESLDHANRSIAQEERQQPCPECLAAANANQP